ncbi:MAG: hypothetical protein LBG80_03095 [Bacteroidales bacterium]|jgi:hypothetical protein|nr:hypothetical protein [Bacteroidales bacterium]
MKKNSRKLGNMVSIIFDHTSRVFNCILNTFVHPFTGTNTTTFIILESMGYGDITEGLLAHVKRWHGSIGDRFSCINNLINVYVDNGWTKPIHFQQLVTYRDELQKLINRCDTPAASAIDRQERNSKLKAAVNLCLKEVKMYTFGLYANEQITAVDVHELGFLLPGEQSGHRSRKEPTDIIAEVKVETLNEDYVRVVIDQSAAENAGPVLHGWPKGVKNAVIVIMADDGVTEVVRHLTTKLHSDIRMPQGSHGKQFIIKAAFLRHIDDDPKFGNEPTFTMSMTTSDLAARSNKQKNNEDN